MEVTLRCNEGLPHGQAILNVLKATLQYPANPQEKGEKLAEDISFFCNSSEGDDGGILWEVWWVVIDIVQCIPSDHLWQDSLLQALHSLHQRDGAVVKDKDWLLWEDLPDLSMIVRERWEGSGYILAPTEIGEEEIEGSAGWKNFNSFVARVTSTFFDGWLHFGIWELRETLEEPPVKGSAMESRIWVASVWIIHCADILYEHMNSNEKLDENEAQAIRTGTLVNDIQPLSVERWEFWKKRFSKLAADAGSLGLGTDIIGKISDALKSMDGVKG